MTRHAPLRLAAAALAAAVALTPLFAAAQARHDRDRDRDRDRRHEWRGDIRHFRDHDFDRWRGGHWFHGHHEGREGWWWIVGSLWYLYPVPAYPYPDPYAPPVAVSPPPPQYWYYCPTSRTYYPYTATCNVPWQRVPVGAPPPG